jgi:Uma2 family endonuclease
MGETGILPPDLSVELLDGQIIDMARISPPHGGIVKRLNRWFSHALSDDWIVSILNPVHLDDYSEPRPDVALLKPADDFYISRHPGPEDVFLLIEVSDTTLDFDREIKLPAYGRAGVAEVWIESR